MQAIDNVPIWEKYILTIKEAEQYFNIGNNRFRELINNHKYDNFIIMNGSKILIKRKQFEDFLNSVNSI